jgi:hypothetical protein
MKSLRHILVAALLIAPLPALAGAELLLKDGQLFVGESVERKGDYMLLRISDDEVFTVPIELVAEMRLTGDDDPDASGIEPAVAETLVGEPGAAHTPDTDEQLAVFEKPAAFRESIIDPVWRPDTDWPDGDPGNEFHPVDWYDPPINPRWTPRSAFKQSGDVTQFNPVKWYRPAIDSTWRPRDGFGPTIWFNAE